MAGQEEVYKQEMSLGHSAAWDQNWADAAQHFRAALEEFPERKSSLTSLGLAFYEMKKYDEALKCYTRAAELSPGDPMPIEKSAQIFERSGNIKLATERSMEAAELYLQVKDVDKAVENWMRVTRLVPEHLKAHARLALVHERLGRSTQAVREYISVAALLQDIGQIEEAIKTVERAVKLDPENLEARNAFELVKAYKTLPKPKKSEDDAAARMAAIKEMDKQLPPGAEEIVREGPDPIAEARQNAMTALAEVLFDVSSDDVDEQKAERRGLSFSLSGDQGPDFHKISRHLGRAIDLQTRANEDEAAKYLAEAIKEGLDFPPAYFNLGLLYHLVDKSEKAQKYLHLAVKHPDYALAARLLIGAHEREQGNLSLAVEHYLEALANADCVVVDPGIAEPMRLAYEPLIETLAQEDDETILQQIFNNIDDLLLRNNWRKRVLDARQQLPTAMTGRLVIPLGEVITQASSSEMVDGISQINELARQGHLRSAMEEAYIMLEQSPTYLPLHIHMGELLLKQDRQVDAINKFTIIAQAYSSRGEASRSTDLLRKIVDISPLDLKARNRLIDQLTSAGDSSGALEEYINLADVHYRMAELDRSRSTYQQALTLAQTANADRSFGERILSQMADIDMQRLDWRQALLVFAQLRTLNPNDQKTRRQLIELNIRLTQEKQAEAEMDNYMTYLSGQARENDAIEFLEDLTKEIESQIFVRKRLAQSYQQAGRGTDAIAQWDQIAEKLVDEGNNEGAKEAIRAILVLNPPNVDQYRQLLQKL